LISIAGIEKERALFLSETVTIQKTERYAKAILSFK
jgi:hypothetical protein